MGQNIRAELISIGTELLLGEITDTNSVYMARALRDMGVDVYYMVSVGDNRGRIAETIRTSLARSDVVITCGGLGPTVDDMTRQAVADATDRGLVFHQALLDGIAARFEKYRVQMTDNNRQQAYLPAGAVVVENEVGTAPAFIVEVGGKCVVSLPGVPREMKYLLDGKVLPFIRVKYGIEEQVILVRILKTAGIGESTLDMRIGRDLLEGANPTVGLAAHSGQIDIRITAKADTSAAALALIEPVEGLIRDRVGSYIFGVDADRLEVALAELLTDVGVTVAITETGIGGMLQARLSDVLGDGLATAETFSEPATLAASLGLPPDTGLQALAEGAAGRLLASSGASVCVGVVSRPDVDENADQEVGTAVVVCTEAASRARVYGFGGRSKNAEQFVGNWGLSVAWHMVRELIGDA